MALTINAAVGSNMGKVRKNNEDNFYFNGLYMNEEKRNQGGLFSRKDDNAVQIYAVCDGMGGADAGEDASICAVRELEKFATSGNGISDAAIRTMIVNTSNMIADAAAQKCISSGTTIAMMVLNNNQFRTVHVGDSRVYTMLGSKLKRLTVDHSEVQRLFSMGLITEAEMRTHPKRHMISQFMGMPRDDATVSPTISTPVPLVAGQRFVLCSDGLTDMVTDEEIESILAAAETASDAAKQLVLAALRNGGKDNVTVIVLYVCNATAGKKSSAGTGKRKWLLSLTGMIFSGIMILTLLFMLLWDFVL